VKVKKCYPYPEQLMDQLMVHSKGNYSSFIPILHSKRHKKYITHILYAAGFPRGIESIEFDQMCIRY